MHDIAWFIFFAFWPIGSGGLLFLFVRFVKARLERRVWLQLAVGNVLVLLLFCSLIFLGGEIYYRFIYDSSDAFNYTRISKRWYDRYFRQNIQAFRDNVDYTLQIPHGKRRISFVGDSFTAGHGIKEVENRFANRIRETNPQWEVQVLANVGADTGGEHDMLKDAIQLGCQLDQVVLVYCLNDIQDIVPEWNDVMARIYTDNGKQNWLVRNSYFANTLYYRLKARRDPNIANYYQFLLPAYQGRFGVNRRSDSKRSETLWNRTADICW